MAVIVGFHTSKSGGSSPCTASLVPCPLGGHATITENNQAKAILAKLGSDSPIGNNVRDLSPQEIKALVHTNPIETAVLQVAKTYTPRQATQQIKRSSDADLIASFFSARKLTPAEQEKSLDMALQAVMEGHNNPGRVNGTGTLSDPIDVKGDYALAAVLIAQGKHIRLNKTDQVGTLVEQLQDIAVASEKLGLKAPTFDLCKVSVPGTNVFCSKTKGIPRIQMPQLGGTPVPGSISDSWSKDSKGNADATPALLERLSKLGVKVSNKRVQANYLKASQGEINGGKVAGLVGAIKSGVVKEAPIFVTRDGYVIDGHHRWAANLAIDTASPVTRRTMPVIEIDMEVMEALDFVNAFTKEVGISSQAV